MIRRFALLTLTLLSGCLWAQDEAEVFPPELIPPDRYEVMRKRSPFVLPTREEPQVEAAWSSDFQIVSILKSGDEWVVLAKSVSTGERMPIRTQANAKGIRLLNLQMSADPREVSALISMGDVEGTITYDPALLSSVPSPSAAVNPALKSE